MALSLPGCSGLLVRYLLTRVMLTHVAFTLVSLTCHAHSCYAHSFFLSIRVSLIHILIAELQFSHIWPLISDLLILCALIMCSLAVTVGLALSKSRLSRLHVKAIKKTRALFQLREYINELRLLWISVAHILKNNITNIRILWVCKVLWWK